MGMFSQPTGGGFFKPAEHEGHLILIVRTHGFDKHFDTLKGAEIDRATVDLVDLTRGGELRERVWLTHPGLVNKCSTDSPTLGRIGKVQAAKGPAWALVEFEEGTDDVLAERWMNSRGNGNGAPRSAYPAPAASAGTSMPQPAQGDPGLAERQREARERVSRAQANSPMGRKLRGEWTDPQDPQGSQVQPPF